MVTKNSRTLIASAVSMALSSMMLATSPNAGEIQVIDLKNFGTYDPGLGEFVTIYDRDVSGGTAGAISYGEIGWDILKAEAPGIIVYNNTPIYGNPAQQIIADCVMAPRIPALLVDTDGDGIGDLDKQCNDTFQTHKRYKMSANAIGPIDMVFTVKNVDAVATIYDKDGTVVATDQNGALNVYRMIGKLNNHTGARMGGFEVKLGFGLGAGFVASQATDGLKISLLEEGATVGALTDNNMAEFPGGLFYGPADDKHDYGFFSDERAGFTVDTALITGAGEDSFTSTAITTNYSTPFGEWLPINWVPPGWFYDFDGNPATDASLQAWWNGTKWLYGNDPATGLLPADPTVPAATLVNWESTLPTVWNDDGDAPPVADTDPVQTLGGTLYATWNPATELYDLAAGGTMTNADMTIAIGTSATLERRPGYVRGPIEDLANLNLNYFIEVGEISSWPGYDAVSETATFTLRITPLAALDDTQNVEPVWITNPPPETTTPPPPTTDSDDGGCTIGNNNRFDPVFPALVAMGLGYFGLRRFKASK